LKTGGAFDNTTCVDQKIDPIGTSKDNVRIDIVEWGPNAVVAVAPEPSVGRSGDSGEFCPRGQEWRRRRGTNWAKPVVYVYQTR